MNVYPDCIPCFMRQALDVCRVIGLSDGEIERIMRRVITEFAGYRFDSPPPLLAREIYRILREETGVADPYLQMKRRSNQEALGLYPALKEKVKASSWPFETAVRIAIAGNIMDFGVATVGHAPLSEGIEHAMAFPLEGVRIRELETETRKAKRILYIGDNAGEIVMDRILIEEMPLEKITYAVKSGPIINDALLEDAETAGLTRLVRVIDCGFDAPGTVVEKSSPAFRRAFDEADLIISKGQGNYETLEMTRAKNIFFLLKVKCPVISKFTGRPLGEILILR